MKIKLIFSVPVWGKIYIENFLLYSLPSQLAFNNLPYLKQKGCLVEYYIYTTKKDKVFFENSSAFKRLKTVVNVQFVWIDNKLKNDKYNIMTYSHADTMRIKSEIDDYMCLMVSDAIYSSSFFRYIYDQIIDNKKVIYMLGFRTDPSFASVCREKYYESATSSIAIDSSILSQIAINNMHISSSSHIMSQNTFTSWVSVLIEKCSTGLIMKGFHLHPIVIKANKMTKNINDFYSIDGSELTILEELEDDEIGFIDDSRYASMYTFELDSKRTSHIVANREFNLLALASWIKQFAGANHLQLVKKDFIVNSHDSLDLNKKLEELNKVVNKAKELCYKDITFENFMKVQQEYIHNNFDTAKEFILHMTDSINEYLNTFMTNKKTLKRYKLEINKVIDLLEDFKNTSTFFEIIQIIGNILNEIGGGKGYFSIFEEHQAIIKKIKKFPDDVILYGFGNFGKEIFFLMNYFGKKIEFIIDDNTSIEEHKGVKIIKFSDLKEPKILNNYHVVLSLGDMNIKNKLKTHLEKQDIKIYDVF